jgi:hypothetical protein
MRKNPWSMLVIGVTSCALLLAASAASAATSKKQVPHSPTVLATPPPGYRVVQSSSFAAPNGTQSHGSVTCPGRKQPASGGAVVVSDSINAAINSSYPSGQSWEIDVNNTSGADTTFTVYAVCLAASAKYTVVTSSTTANPQSLTIGAAFCPAHTWIVGGGVLSETTSTLNNITVTDPIVQPHGVTWWHVYFNNADTSASTFVVYAVCHGKPTGYAFQLGSIVNNPSGTQTEASVTCPGASVPLGGGGGEQIQNGDNAVTMNSTFPSGNTWNIYENNGEPTDRDIDAQMVCAGT